MTFFVTHPVLIRPMLSCLIPSPPNVKSFVFFTQEEDAEQWFFFWNVGDMRMRKEVYMISS